MPDSRLGGGHPINFRPAGPSLPEPAKCFWPFLPFLTPADESNAEPLEGTLIGGEKPINFRTPPFLTNPCIPYI